MKMNYEECAPESLTTCESLNMLLGIWLNGVLLLVLDSVLGSWSYGAECTE